MAFIESVVRLQKSAPLQLAVDYDGSKKEFYSCGFDDSITKWALSASGSPEPDIFACNRFCGNIAVNKDIYVGEITMDVLTEEEQHVVNKYDAVSKVTFDLLKFSLPVTALDVSCDGKYLIAGAEDYFLKTIQLNKEDAEYCKVELSAIAISISISPSSDIVAVSTSDGFVSFYAIKPGELKQIKQMKVLPHFNKIDLSSNKMRVAWHPFDSKIYLPSSDGILVVNTKSWTQDQTIKPVSDKFVHFSIICVTSDGNYFAAYSTDDNIYVYQTAAFQLVSEVDLKGRTIGSMIFDPSNEKNLILADNTGMMHVIEEATKLQVNLNDIKMKAVDEDMNISDPFDTPIDKVTTANDDIIGIDDEDDIGAIKSRYGFDATSQHKNVAPAPQLPAELLEKLKRPVCTVTQMRCAPTFITGSTPARGGERFLKWNTYGQIRMFKTEEHISTEIEFHDSSVHAEIIINDQEFIMGDLNDNIIALASESELYVRLVNSFDLDNRIWVLEMPEKELIQNIAVGGDFVAIFTSERYIRIFTAAGTQRAMFSVRGPVVTMVAHENCLALPMNSGGVLVHSENSFEHQIELDMYEVNVFDGGSHVLRKLRTSPVALSPESSLKWLSFSSSGQICTMDSDYVVRLLSPADFWIPIFEGSSVLNNASYGFWPIAVLDAGSHLCEPKIRHLVCKSNEFPLPSKNLTPITVKLSVPLCNKDTTKTNDENELLLIEVMLSAKQLTAENPKDMNELYKHHLMKVLKLFANSVMAKKDNRAAEFVEITNGLSGVNKICELAAKIGSKGLSEKINKIAQNRYSDDKVKPSSAGLYNHQDAPLSKRSFKRKTVTSTSYSQEEFNGRASKLTRKTYEESQDIIVDSQMNDDELRSEVSFSVLNKPKPVLSLNDSVASVASPCNPFKKNNISSQMSSTTTGDSQDFFSSMATPSARSTPSEVTTKSTNKKVKITQAKLDFGGTKTTAFKAKENISQQGNAITPFSLWVRDNEANLRKEIDVDDEDAFTKLAANQFRSISKEEKDKYKRMASSNSQI